MIGPAEAIALNAVLILGIYYALGGLGLLACKAVGIKTNF